MPEETVLRLVDSVHALLFAANTPATPQVLAEALQVPVFEVEEALERLGRRLSDSGPLLLARIAGGYQLATKPEYADPLARFLQPQQMKLSRSLMETLAIIAYKQPITMAEIDAIRGVQSDYSLKQLLEKRMVVELGRKQSPGRPLLYGTTQQFLHLFNLDSLAELPQLSTPHGDLLALETHESPDQPALSFESAPDGDQVD